MLFQILFHFCNITAVFHELKYHFSFGNTTYILGISLQDIYRFMEYKYKIGDHRLESGIF